MTTLALAALAREVPGLKAVGRFFTAIAEGVREARAIETRYEALSRLSDQALAARGLSREEIPQAAVSGKYGS
jgi:hypothetical protein